MYGIPEQQPIDEETPTRPINPYGATKLAVDRAIQFYGEATNLAGISLRYFNAAGAHPDGCIGEDKTPASNLVPKLFDVALGNSPQIAIYGDDYPTPDGTGVRDYVHVLDLASAHELALGALEAPGFEAINLGTGHGASVKQVLAAAELVTGREVPLVVGPRREGDPPRLVASNARAKERLGWEPRASTMERILEDAWRWHQAHPRGYA